MWIVYKTTCVINNKIYIGVHKTDDDKIFDGYIGCGINIFKSYKLNLNLLFHKAINKYGDKNFIRETLFKYDNKLDALKKERELVDFEFLKRNDVYNTALGGSGGTKLSHPIQYDLKGNFVKQWDSVEEISNYYNCNIWTIHDAMSKKIPIFGFYFLNHKINIYKIIENNNKVFIRNKLKISCYDPVTLKLIKTYSGITEITRIFHCGKPIIKKHIKNKTIFKNYLWCYSDNDIYNGQQYYEQQKVYQYTENWEFVKEWESIRECYKHFPKVREVLRGVRNHTHHFKFTLNKI